MSRKKIYIVRSGSLNTAAKEYWFSNSYHTSKRRALKCKEMILEINRAKDINPDGGVKLDNTISIVDYVGEEGKYKARIIIEWAYLDNYY